MAFDPAWLFIDGFAGGGGASTGIAQAIGREVDIAINHDPIAIAIHAANPPGTEHHCNDIRAVWPLAATRHRPVGGAWFSPDCKEHSKAKGGPVKDRHIRHLAWEVVNWLKDTRPLVGFVENVEEFQQWGPLDPETGHIIKEMRGAEFRRWVKTIKRLGYRIDWRELRACDYGAPTSRKRLYIIMRCDGAPVTWPARTHGNPANDNDAREIAAGRLQPWRTAAECIDWSIRCPSIFERIRELKDATKRRIAHGVMRYVVNAARPFIVGTAFANTRASRVFDPDEPLRTSTTQPEYGVVDGTIIPVTHGGDLRAHDVAEPLRTITTANGGEFALSQVQLAPHITKFHTGSVGSDMGAPLPTVTSNGDSARDAGATPLGIVAAAMAPLQNGERRPGEKPREQDLAAPLSTIATGGKHSVVETQLVAAHLDRQFGNSVGAAADQPAPATTAGGGGKTAAVTAFLSSYNGSDKRGAAGDPLQPLPTIRTGGGKGGGHRAVVAAHVEQANTGMVGHDARKPLSTIVGKGCTQRIVETTLIEEGALPPELMTKAVRVAAFIIKYYGSETGAHRVDEPLATVTTRERFAVVTVTIDAVTYVIVDIGLRMLTPRELARAQGFPDSYVLDPVVPRMIRGKLVHAPLPKAAQIRAIGNSVCPDVARALVAANRPRFPDTVGLAA
ncbi:DNA cytosine methyltransferase [Sphingomonas sanxanigenens]|uniref:DNA (cytosine-5-)-methyltransferase n=1 Tax=Sphingomonas sanxanigenens DSM 19645 = NX02 TaxID=1123269 RepID=W0A6B1_9SPHN|nr:DNA cytosine methyltransferase [Sphingomonas sanxanigenens]AHE52596.1 hypothetical protein NX02_04240 [Sphingomonas sanxanigenens DSM 19645 = NX02]